jgi:flagellar assembly factor FliW
MDPFLFMPDYQVNVDTLIAEMDWKNINREDLLIYVVVNISGKNETKKITANLMGPLVINPKTNQAVQLIMADSPYSCHYDILAASSA